MQDLRYSLRRAEESGVHKHPQMVMRELGIAYVMATPQSMGDQWWFWGCTWDSENLGDLSGFLTPLNLNPKECVGFGLSQEDADAIVKAKADAQLIAAAPELLEALELFVEDFTERNDPSTWMPGERAVIEQSRKAIAKAKGETK